MNWIKGSRRLTLLLWLAGMIYLASVHLEFASTCERLVYADGTVTIAGCSTKTKTVRRTQAEIIAECNAMKESEARSGVPDQEASEEFKEALAWLEGSLCDHEGAPLDATLVPGWRDPAPWKAWAIAGAIWTAVAWGTFGALIWVLSGFRK